ncbi:hypothetical protein [Legionella saoudiensis]|uniref:hypothetical protein n=1 Tax=Legionella saoudiensis TaxID=1750561 RepID=UPI0007318429|nr:hypothetical protein [Legionella saoudiensis]
MKKLLISVWLILFCQQAFCVPKKIVVIRHADKAVQTNRSQALSAQGLVRSIKFAYYFLNNFGEPDFFFAKSPNDEKGGEVSIRELQTIAPLANITAQFHPEEPFNSHPINRKFTGAEYQKLANHILTHEKFNNKIIVICWNHKNLPDLAVALGATSKPADWSDDNFDSVYVFEYGRRGKLYSFTILDNQYPVEKITWEKLHSYLQMSQRDGLQFNMIWSAISGSKWGAIF